MVKQNLLLTFLQFFQSVWWLVRMREPQAWMSCSAAGLCCRRPAPGCSGWQWTCSGNTLKGKDHWVWIFLKNGKKILFHFPKNLARTIIEVRALLMCWNKLFISKYWIIEHCTFFNTLAWYRHAAIYWFENEELLDSCLATFVLGKWEWRFWTPDQWPRL